ncbi:hypothetical protein SKAU_G00300560 [Synaphobranchus kaupii]|uniref:Uncharacterized protein n=1 Tax=Synaphobranchus kaupii TaxID=118154 RepID=A0A9Q1EVM5_SYNKA|nr:hypothetical protein SKAU_G00300560 [Synaphobranchus kaupii]
MTAAYARMYAHPCNGSRYRPNLRQGEQRRRANGVRAWLRGGRLTGRAPDCPARGDDVIRTQPQRAARAAASVLLTDSLTERRGGGASTPSAVTWGRL